MIYAEGALISGDAVGRGGLARLALELSALVGGAGVGELELGVRRAVVGVGRGAVTGGLELGVGGAVGGLGLECGVITSGLADDLGGRRAVAVAGLSVAVAARARALAVAFAVNVAISLEAQEEDAGQFHLSWPFLFCLFGRLMPERTSGGGNGTTLAKKCPARPL